MLTVTLLSLLVAAGSAVVAWRSIRREQRRSEARVALLAAAIDLSPAFRSAAGAQPALEFLSEESIDDPGPPPSVRRRLVTMTVGAAVIVAAVVAIAMMSDRYEPPAARVVSPHAQSLELLALDAAREGSSLAVTGLVRSRTEEPLTTVTAVVSAIDAKGRLVGRGTVPLAAILPRRESRFVVTVADVDGAARYRVSFRSATGVIRHVDRRVDRAGRAS